MEVIRPSHLFLKDIYERVEARSKAIKHRGGVLTCERIIERNDDDEAEKLEFTYSLRRSTKSPSFRLFIWDDRWVWVDAREASKQGWKWEWTEEGRATGQDIGSTLAKALENSLDELTNINGNAPAELEIIWRPILMDGRLQVIK